MKTERDGWMRFKKSGKTEVERYWEKVSISDGCWEWQGYRSPSGYGSYTIRLSKDKTHPIRAHRYMWMLVNGPIPEGMAVCHRCDNRRCVRPDHLFLGTLKDNARDCAAKGRMAKQRDPYLGRTERKLTADKVRHIRNTYTGRHGEMAEMARQYGVCNNTIRHILILKIWRQVA